jgi:hypothetical protein
MQFSSVPINTGNYDTFLLGNLILITVGAVRPGANYAGVLARGRERAPARAPH